jgi:hypothetical protein
MDLVLVKLSPTTCGLVGFDGAARNKRTEPRMSQEVILLGPDTKGVLKRDSMGRDLYETKADAAVEKAIKWVLANGRRSTIGIDQAEKFMYTAQVDAYLRQPAMPPEVASALQKEYDSEDKTGTGASVGGRMYTVDRTRSAGKITQWSIKDWGSFGESVQEQDSSRAYQYSPKKYSKEIAGEVKEFKNWKWTPDVLRFTKVFAFETEAGADKFDRKLSGLHTELWNKMQWIPDGEWLDFMYKSYSETVVQVQFINDQNKAGLKLIQPWMDKIDAAYASISESLKEDAGEVKAFAVFTKFKDRWQILVVDPNENYIRKVAVQYREQYGADGVAVREVQVPDVSSLDVKWKAMGLSGQGTTQTLPGTPLKESAGTSSSRYAHAYAAADGNWYLEVAPPLEDTKRFAVTYGPFPSVDAAVAFLKEKFQLDPSLPSDDSHKRPEPYRSPSGQPVILPSEVK